MLMTLHESADVKAPDGVLSPGTARPRRLAAAAATIASCLTSLQALEGVGVEQRLVELAALSAAI